jgi:hypothetical protein
MSALPLTRTYYIDPQTGTPRAGDATDGESAVDSEQYYVLTGQVHGAGLHEWGIGNGFAVSATLNNINATALTVTSGVGVDVNGQHIYLPVGNKAEIDPNAANSLAENGQVSNLQTMTANGIALPTIGFTGDQYLTIEYRDTFDLETFFQSGETTYQVLHTPWLRLLPAQGYQDDGTRLVLAKATIDPNLGITALTPDLRRQASLPAQRIHLRAPQQVAAGSVDNLPTGDISAYPGGGIQLRGQHVLDAIRFVRSNGSESITIVAENGMLVVGTAGLAGRINVFDSAATSVAIDGTSSSVNAGRMGLPGTVNVVDTNGNPVVISEGTSARVTVGGSKNPGVIRTVDGTGDTTVQIEAATGVARLKRLAAIVTGDSSGSGSNTIDVDARKFHIHAFELGLDGFSGGNKRALVDGNNLLQVNYANDYINGVSVNGLHLQDHIKWDNITFFFNGQFQPPSGVWMPIYEFDTQLPESDWNTMSMCEVGFENDIFWFSTPFGWQVSEFLSVSQAGTVVIEWWIKCSTSGSFYPQCFSVFWMAFRI